MLAMLGNNRGLAPTFSLEVEGTDVGPDVSALVGRLEYEEADGMAAVLRLHMANPNYILTRKKLLQPGNEIAAFLGYGTDKTFVGRAIVAKSRPSFPSREMPTLDIVAYSRDYQMMQNEPEKGKERCYSQAALDAVVSGVADRWGFETDVDPSENVMDVVQKAGMSDWELVRGCSNIDGFWLWVDGDEKGKWWLHYKSPSKPVPQDFKTTLKYNSGESTTLDSFDPESTIQGGMTKLRVLAVDCLKGEVINEEVEAEDDPADTKFTGTLEEELPDTPPSREAIKLFIKDFSFSVVPSRPFRNAGEATAWARSWFARHRQEFITAKGRTVVGIPALRARQVHAISGVSEDHDGDYFFSRVAHVFSNEDGYTCDFDCRKVIKD